MLNAIYAKYAPQALPEPPTKQGEDIDSDASSTSTSDAESTVSASEPPRHEEQLLLTRDAVPEITAQFETPPNATLATDLYRAMEQAALRLKESGQQSRS